jgi:hypothetical protein
MKLTKMKSNLTLHTVSLLLLHVLIVRYQPVAFSAQEGWTPTLDLAARARRSAVAVRDSERRLVPVIHPLTRLARPAANRTLINGLTLLRALSSMLIQLQIQDPDSRPQAQKLEGLVPTIKAGAGPPGLLRWPDRSIFRDAAQEIHATNTLTRTSSLMSLSEVLLNKSRPSGQVRRLRQGPQYRETSRGEPPLLCPFLPLVFRF